MHRTQLVSSAVFLVHPISHGHSILPTLSSRPSSVSSSLPLPPRRPWRLRINQRQKQHPGWSQQNLSLSIYKVPNHFSHTCSTTKSIHDKFVFSIFDAPSAETEDAATSDYGPETYPYAQQCAPVFNRMWGFQTAAQDRLLTSDSSIHTTHAPPSYTDATLAQLA